MTETTHRLAADQPCPFCGRRAAAEAELAQAREENQRLRAALALYADPESYRETGTAAHDVVNEPWVWGDQGDEARAALEGTT